MNYFSLLKEGLNCVVVKDGAELYTSCDRGIKPILDLLDNHLDILDGSIVVDKIIGRASAFILSGCGVKKVCATVMSEGACELLEQSGIQYEYIECVPAIINRQNTGICPMEAAVAGISDREEAISAIRKRIIELSAKKG